jgi:hypothetical protein
MLQPYTDADYTNEGKALFSIEGEMMKRGGRRKTWKRG